MENNDSVDPFQLIIGVIFVGSKMLKVYSVSFFSINSNIPSMLPFHYLLLKPVLNRLKHSQVLNQLIITSSRVLISLYLGLVVDFQSGV